MKSHSLWTASTRSRVTRAFAVAKTGEADASATSSVGSNTSTSLPWAQTFETPLFFHRVYAEMAKFWDLPKPVRERIYRLHLVDHEPITTTKHMSRVGQREIDWRNPHRNFVPPICSVSLKAEKEAAPIYYGENHFSFSTCASGIFQFTAVTYTRHLRLMRKVTCGWPGETAREMFLEIARMKGLQELNISVDEKDMVYTMLHARYHRQRSSFSDEPTPQQQLAILRHPGMTGLLSISGVREVRFLQRTTPAGHKSGGPIPNGVLETLIKPKIMASKRARANIR